MLAAYRWKTKFEGKLTSEEGRSNFVAVLALAVLIYSVIRGLVPLLTGDPGLARPAYFAAAIFGILLSCYGLYLALFTSRRLTIGEWPHRLLVINALLYTAWLIPVLIFNPKYEFVVIVHSALFPFAVYALIKIPEKILTLTIGFLTLIVSAFVIREFIELNASPVPDSYGYRLAFERQALLRPHLFEAFSKTGDFYRPNGLFGFRPHDSGNILAILFVYWLAMLFRAGKYVFPASMVASATLIALFYTSSAANIVASLVGVIFVLVAGQRSMGWGAYSFWRPILVFVPVLAAMSWGLSQYGVAPALPTNAPPGMRNGVAPEALWAWTRRLSTTYGDWKGMTNIGAGDPFGDTAAVLFGHGISLQITQIGEIAEASMLKGLVEYGIVHTFVIYALLLYPVALFFSKKYRECRLDVLPYVAAVAVGVLSLWHYGSVMRTTNIFVFFALYAQALHIFNKSAEQRQPVPGQQGKAGSLPGAVQPLTVSGKTAITVHVKTIIIENNRC
jgi:hypothetical protein